MTTNGRSNTSERVGYICSADRQEIQGHTHEEFLAFMRLRTLRNNASDFIAKQIDTEPKPTKENP